MPSNAPDLWLLFAAGLFLLALASLRRPEHRTRRVRRPDVPGQRPHSADHGGSLGTPLPSEPSRQSA